MIVDVAKRESDIKALSSKEYTQAERALNLYIQENFPEWGCKSI